MSWSRASLGRWAGATDSCCSPRWSPAWGLGPGWRAGRARGPVRPRLFGGMLLEAILYAALLGGVAGGLTSLLLHGRLAVLLQPGGSAGGFGGLGLPAQLMGSLGAGLYEEL